MPATMLAVAADNKTTSEPWDTHTTKMAALTPLGTRMLSQQRKLLAS